MTKAKLLTDEEMLQRIQDICDRVHAGLLPTDGAGGIVNLINTQKRLYAEIVVGDYPKNADRKNISDVMAEQRARIK